MQDLAGLFDAELFLKFAVAFAAVANPLYTIPVFLGLTQDYSPSERRKTAHIIALSAFVTAVVVTLIGEEILGLFGISQQSFQIGGGIIVLLLGLSMLRADAASVAEEARKKGKQGVMSIAIVPLTIPATIGPGAIATIILFAHLLGNASEIMTMIPVIAIMSGFIWLGLLFADPVSRLLGETTINVITRIMAIILVAVAVEMAMNGAVDFIVNHLPGVFPKANAS